MAASSGVTDSIAAVRRKAVVPAGPLVVALSGGADSAVCAWAALDAGRDVRAVFVDHGFAESAAMGAAAAAVASSLGIDLDAIAVVVPRGASPEGRARLVRHAALVDGLKPGETLLSGHTADDQAETVLGNVLRGAGATGVAGIPQRRGPWARPLLSLSRDTVRSAAAALGLPYVDDPTNESIEPRRNQLRHQVLPMLRERFNPEVTEALQRTAALAAADDELLESRAAAVPLTRTAQAVKVPAAALAMSPPAVASRIARRAIRLARGPHGGEATEVAAVVAAAGGATTTIGGAVQVSREGPWVVLATAEPEPWHPVDIAIPGETSFCGGTLIATHGAPPWRPAGRDMALVEGAGRLTVRRAEPGDRVDIGGGHKKVVTALAEAGVGPRLRRHWPVVVSGGIISWVIGVRSAPLPVPVVEPVLLSARLEDQ
jgi:tRNA(Ile)-lysidine synthase